MVLTEVLRSIRVPAGTTGLLVARTARENGRVEFVRSRKLSGRRAKPLREESRARATTPPGPRKRVAGALRRPFGPVVARSAAVDESRIPFSVHSSVLTVPLFAGPTRSPHRRPPTEIFSRTTGKIDLVSRPGGSFGSSRAITLRPSVERPRGPSGRAREPDWSIASLWSLGATRTSRAPLPSAARTAPTGTVFTAAGEFVFPLAYRRRRVGGIPRLRVGFLAGVEEFRPVTPLCLSRWCPGAVLVHCTFVPPDDPADLERGRCFDVADGRVLSCFRCCASGLAVLLFRGVGCLLVAERWG